jgi:ankyrin repeat protein
MGQIFSWQISASETIEQEKYKALSHTCRRCGIQLEIFTKYHRHFSSQEILRYERKEVNQMMCEDCTNSIYHRINYFFTDGNYMTDVDYDSRDPEHFHIIFQKGKHMRYNDSKSNHFLRNVCLPETNNCRISNYNQFQVECCRVLLDMGADINSKYGEDSPLSNACMGENIDLVKFLLDNNANPNQTIFDDYTTLMYCCSYGKKEFASLLISRGANFLQTWNATLIGVNDVKYTRLVRAIDIYGYDCNPQIGIFSPRGIELDYLHTQKNISKLFNQRNELICEHFELSFPGCEPPLNIFPDFLTIRCQNDVRKPQGDSSLERSKHNEIDRPQNLAKAYTDINSTVSSLQQSTISLCPRTILKARAIDIRNFMLRRSDIKVFTKKHRKSVNLVIHFDDIVSNANKPIPQNAVSNVEEAYKIMKKYS